MTAYLLKRRICTNGSASKRVNTVLFKGHDLQLSGYKGRTHQREKAGSLTGTSSFTQCAIGHK